MNALPATPLPALSSAHQQQLNLLIDDVASCNVAPEHLDLLRHLAADLPRLRDTLPAETRDALHALDANETALRDAVPEFVVAIESLTSILPLQHMQPSILLDAAMMRTLATQAHAVSQIAAEIALRSKKRAELLQQTSA